jgi:hypothetical protein
MPLLFDDRQLLVDGVHDASLEVVEEHFSRFQRTGRRIKLSEGHVEMIDKLKAEIDEYFTAHPELCGPPNGTATDANGHAAAER